MFKSENFENIPVEENMALSFDIKMEETFSENYSELTTTECETSIDHPDIIKVEHDLDYFEVTTTACETSIDQSDLIKVGLDWDNAELTTTEYETSMDHSDIIKVKHDLDYSELAKTECETSIDHSDIIKVGHDLNHSDLTTTECETSIDHSKAFQLNTDIISELIFSSFNNRTFNEKKKLIDNGKPTPKINLTKVNKEFTRKFNVELYNSVSWLCGSTSTNKLYCWPCVLFSKKHSAWSEASKGYGDLNNIHNAITRHTKCVAHIQSYVDLKQFGKTRVKVQLDKQKEAFSKHNENVLRNRQILKRLIRITCLLGTQELTFQSLDESELVENRGNYVELAYFLAEFDEKLENHLKTPTIFKGLSKTIQNDIVSSVCAVLISAIRKDLSDCRYVAVLLDETSDVSCFSRLSTIVRYIDKNGNICERFLGFTEVSKCRSVEDVSRLIVKHLDELGCTQKLVAQSYDGAAVMAAELNGVQAKIKEVAPEAAFVHCYTHEFNLILSQAVSHIPKCNMFFSVLTSLSSFVISSTKRTSVLDDIVGKCFPKLTPTRWNSSSKLVQTVKDNFENLKNLFDYIHENPKLFDHRMKNEARGFSVALNSFDFKFLLQVFSTIFPLTDYLQTKFMDVVYCSFAVESTLSKIQDFRETKFANIWEVTTQNNGLPMSRKRGDISLETSYQQTFFDIWDNITEQLKARFMSLKNMEFLKLLDFKKSKHHDKIFPEKELQSLKNNYSAFFDFACLKSELSVLYSQNYFAQDDVNSLLKYIMINDLLEVFPQVYSLVNLVLTLPVLPSSVEQSFSALKRIRSYLRRNLQGQERLSNLSLISIEKDFLKKEMENREQFYSKVTEEFCTSSRRPEFQFK